MEVKGTIKKKLKLQSGTSKAGNEWQKLDVIITQSDEYSKEVISIIEVIPFLHTGPGSSVNVIEQGDSRLVAG